MRQAFTRSEPELTQSSERELNSHGQNDQAHETCHGGSRETICAFWAGNPRHDDKGEPGYGTRNDNGHQSCHGYIQPSMGSSERDYSGDSSGTCSEEDQRRQGLFRI